MSSVRLSDIAEQVGVSTSTVSRAVRTKSQTMTGVQREILRVAKEMGYMRSEFLDKPAIGRVGLITIGLKSKEGSEDSRLGYTPTGFYSRLTCGIERNVREAGGRLSVLNVDNDAGAIEQIKRFVRDDKPQGLVLNVNGDFPRINDVGAICPIVQVNAPQKIVAVDSVAPDDFGGMLNSVNRLIQLGHRRIGFLVDKPTILHHRMRLEGYRYAMASAGIDYERVFADDTAMRGTFMERMKTVFKDITSGSDRPTAVACTCDVFAHALLRLANENGVKVPAELSISGFDNIDASALAFPSLTSVDANLECMGEVAIDLLSQRIAGFEGVCRQVTLQAQVIERESAVALNGEHLSEK